MQAECRLAYFLKYGLRAQERKPVTVDPAEFGTYVHAVLEQTAREIHALGGFKSVSLQQTLEIGQKYSDLYVQEHFSQLDSQRIAYLFQRNTRELMMVVEELWSELQNSDFQPVDFELAFGDGMKLPAIQVQGDRMPAQLRGFVDRVDSWQDNYRNYYRIVDYKTGKKDFDYCDVFNGLGLQMLLYLFALEQTGHPELGESPKPAGVQYFPARVPVLAADSDLNEEEAARERTSQWRRKGLILDDDDVLMAMEHDENPVRLSCRRKKDGTVTGDIASRDQFKLLSRYVFRLLGKMVDEIASGNVEPNP
jgi:ATP-dependent helicase/nuclease subunit B